MTHPFFFLWNKEDLDKYKATKKRQSDRYRQRGGAYLYDKRPYTQAEDEAILKHEVSDLELSKQLRRSRGAIQRHRWELKKNLLPQESLPYSELKKMRGE